jgi:alanine dehydrogenase
MIIGIPKEIKTDEYRVAIVPSGVRSLVLAGHKVLK